jgi:hypothetical protein
MCQHAMHMILCRHPPTHVRRFRLCLMKPKAIYLLLMIIISNKREPESQIGNAMSALLARFVPRITTHTLPSAQRTLVHAMRLAIVHGRAGFSALPKLEPLIGGGDAAVRFVHLIEVMGQCWSEPVRVHRPCCAHVAPDEMALLDILTAAIFDDRGGFDRMLHEMLHEDARTCLYGAARRFVTGCLAPNASVSQTRPMA